MADRVGFKVTGLKEVVAGLRDAGAEMADLKAAFSAIARRGADLAAQAAPRRSGRLAASIRGNRAVSKAVVVAGRATVPYAGAINYGWAKRNIEPALFMQKADQRLRPYAVQQLEDEINQVIGKRGLS